jgi:hypothetical protein
LVTWDRKRRDGRKSLDGPWSLARVGRTCNCGIWRSN